ncbi:MAG: DUF1549 domain-containing protein [Planctomycetes bacterium]|nr:DUF1549 domain-containing protein [Planctomycetota bacterium]
MPATLKRNLVFLAVVAGGVLACVVILSPAIRPLRQERNAAERMLAPDIQTSVDRLNKVFEERWRKQGVEPAPPAGESTVVRRLALALMGTIPSLEELRQLDQQPKDRRVDVYLAKVLDDRRFNDYLAERLARAFVGTKDGVFIAYRRRRFVAWLSDELRERRPYDQTIRRMLTVEGYGTDEPAANFIIASMRPDMGSPKPEPTELASRVARGMLAARIDCAECHDHPFEPWKQADFQSLAAFFGQTAFQGVKGLHNVERPYEVEDRVTGKMLTIAPRAPYLDDDRPKNGWSREQLAAWVTAPKNERFAQAIVNRIWALMFGQGLVEPIDDIRSGQAIQPALKLLADDFREHDYDIHRLIQVIALSRPFRLDSRGTDDGPPVSNDDATPPPTAPAMDENFAIFPLSRLRPEQVAGSLVQCASVTTLNAKTSLVFRVARLVDTGNFVRAYGDLGEEEMQDRSGTIPQQLLLMNGGVVKNKTQRNPVLNTCSQIAMFATSDENAVELVFYTTLSRPPTLAERDYFVDRLKNRHRVSRDDRIGDIAWTLINSTEFSWNH